MPTIEELFGDSESDSEEEGALRLAAGVADDDEKPFNQKVFDKEWDQIEEEWEKQAEQEKKRHEEERKRVDEERAQQIRRYEKHPPRQVGEEMRNMDERKYLFVRVYPHLFNVARKRVMDLLQERNFPRSDAPRRSLELRARQVNRLPCSAKSYHKDVSIFHGWTPQLQMVLKGTTSLPGNKRIKVTQTPTRELTSCTLSLPSCPLALLGGYESTLIRLIFSFLPNYGEHMTITIPADVIMNIRGIRRGRYGLLGSLLGEGSQDLTSDIRSGAGYVAFAKVGQVSNLFPSPKDRNVNMMPFVLGDQESLPEDLQCYYPIIDACPFMRDEFGKVAFLTVQESESVEQGKTQRRAGLHIDSPGLFMDKTASCSFTPGVELLHWGCGSFGGPDRYEGGIYLASNVDDSTAVWDALVDISVPGITDRHGGIDHLKPFLPESDATKLKAGELVWMTDCTPHEALPQVTTGPRTFFRLVMPYVTHWYAAHSTPNPKVSIPDSIVVVEDSKFPAVGSQSSLTSS